MGTFDSPADAPFHIKTEGETITLTFSQGVPVTGQGLVEWNIPAPARGCQTEDGRGAYCGMLVLLSQVPLQPRNSPVDGTFYEADPTADADAHAGDTIAEALVVGAFYEGEKLNRGEEVTTSFIISDLQPNTSYYVAGYAVDCQGRYHTQGVRAYSDLFAGEDEPSLPASQTVVLEGGVIPTDGTGLTPGLIYEFEVDIDPTFPQGTAKRTVKVSVDGSDVSTYEDLVKEINKAIALADNPPQSPVQPNVGRYYWNAADQELSQWDGTTHVPVDAYVEPVDPADPQFGDYWYNADTNELQRWGIPVPGTWNPIDIVSYLQDPTNLVGGDDFWFNGTQAYNWCDTTWCERDTIISTTDPGEVVTPDDCGVYWYDEENLQLFEWDLKEARWVERFAIYWNLAPNNIATGTYWFDTTNDKLFQRGAGWTEIPNVNADPPPVGPPQLVIDEEEPTLPSPDLHWYNPTTEVLNVYNGTTLVWEEQPLIVWPTDPTDVESCDLWWSSVTDELYKWDVVNNEWDQVSIFYKSPTDPLGPPTLEIGTVWYNPSTMEMFEWAGLEWEAVTFIDFPTDPTQPAVGSAWRNTTTGEWQIWDTPNAGWNVINPIDSPTDPFSIAPGALWFDTTNNALFERVGSAWVNVPFSTQPFTPTKGEKWFDSANNILMEWDGTAWVPATTLATAGIDSNGNLTLTTNFTGSDSCIMILVPDGSESGASDGIALGTAGHDFYHYSRYETVPTATTTISTDQFLFDFLMPEARIYRQEYGTDGVKAEPAYKQIGVGDDGSPDERREMVDTIRQQLGYPTIEVELTPYQMNKAVDIALRELRLRSSVAYKRGFFFHDVQPRQQHYKLTDETVGFNKVVTVMSAYRMTSAFLSSAHGAGVYGQVVLQHLYNMGTFDLLSYHLVAQYVEQLEHLFATRLTYHWHESDRLLQYYHVFSHPERILLDVTMERTEQELLKDRWTRSWLERWAYAESMKMLSQVRGKYASLPGAGGGIALNAADLMSQHDVLKEQLLAEIDDYVVNDVEDIGLNSTMIIG